MDPERDPELLPRDVDLERDPELLPRDPDLERDLERDVDLERDLERGFVVILPESIVNNFINSGFRKVENPLMFISFANSFN
jgi:hypothetical protein